MSYSQPFDLPDMPDRIEPGEFELVFMDDEVTGEPEVTEVRFSWNGGGGTVATFRCDAWQSPDDPSFVSEINTSPVYGFASWTNGEDLLIAFSSPLAEEEGWAHFPAPHRLVTTKIQTVRSLIRPHGSSWPRRSLRSDTTSRCLA